MPGLDNDTYTIQSSAHNATILDYIPLDKDNEYETCNVTSPSFNNSSSPKSVECDSYVYSTEQFIDTTVTDVSLYILQLQM